LNRIWLRAWARGAEQANRRKQKKQKVVKRANSLFLPFCHFLLFCFSFRAKESAERMAGDKGFAKALVARLALLDSLAIRLLICLLLVIVYRLVAQG
jgi:hypothetical protein